MDESALKSSDALAALGLSASVFLLAGPWLANLGLTGIILVQVLAFALPALLVAATRPDGWQAIGVRHCKLGALVVTVAIAGSLWYWNVYWVAPLGMDWASVEQNESWRQLVNLSSRSLLETILIFALLPAVCEELLHRGVIAPSLAKRIGFWPGLLLSSLFFGATHLNLARLLPTTLLGLAAGFVRLRSGSLWPAILLHFVYNACLLGAAHAELLLNAPVALASVAATTIALAIFSNILKSQAKSES